MIDFGGDHSKLSWDLNGERAGSFLLLDLLLLLARSRF
jgi:hypothetical protein